VRAWCYVDDFVDALIAAAVLDEANREIFNIGTPGASIDVLGLAQMVARSVGPDARIEFGPGAGAEVEVRVPAIDKAARLLGFAPMVGLEEGIRRTTAWARAMLAERGAPQRPTPT